MNVLIYDPSQGEGARLLGLLRDQGIQASLATDEARLAPMTKQVRTDLVFLCCETFSTDFMQICERLREHHILEPSQIQLVTGPLNEADAAYAFGSGIDSILPWGIERDYLLARVAAVARVLERCERKVGAPPFQVGGETASGLPIRLIVRSNAWRTTPEKVRQVVGQFLGQAAVLTAPLPEGVIEVASSISLLGGAQGIQIRIAVGADNKSALSLASKMFGPDAKDLIDDMLGEVANVAMGTLKNVFGAEQIALTGGLPSPLKPAEVLTPPTTTAHRHVFALDIGSARLTVHVGLVAKSSSSVAVGELREGMVIARDLFNDHGLLLLKGGTRLSATMIKKLTDLLPARLAVAVMLDERKTA
jgi:hypothetical protein